MLNERRVVAALFELHDDVDKTRLLALLQRAQRCVVL